MLPEQGIVVYNTSAQIEPENGHLEVTAALTFLAGADNPTRAAFLLNGGLHLHDVKGVQVTSFGISAFEMVPIWHLVDVGLAESTAPGDTVSINLIYSGELLHGGAQFSSDWLDLNLDVMWHPIFSGFDKNMRGTLHLKLPEGWQAAGSGTTTMENGTHIIRSETNLMDVPFTASPSFRISRENHLSVYYLNADPEKVATVLKTGNDCIGYLNTRFGSRDSIAAARVVLAERAGHFYARKNYVVISVDGVDWADENRLFASLCHEFAHYWTPSPGAFSPDHWMSEAFAEYVAGQSLRQRIGEEAYQSVLKEWEHGGRGQGPVWRPDLASRPGAMAMYARAPYLLHRLEDRIGTETFDRFLMRYMVEDILHTTDLLGELEAIAGTETAQWFMDELAATDW